MKILLISDTHGKLDPVNELAAGTGADCCFHMGDFCIYTLESVSRFSADMLNKQLHHAPVPPAQLAAVDPGDAGSMRLLAIKYQTFGNFNDYLSGEKHFKIPVYAVPGNNEDAETIAWLEKHPIPNLTFLNEKKTAALEDFLICGIGGSISSETVGSSRFGYVSTEQQVKELENRLLKTPISQPKILLSHVPPYECEPLMRLVETVKPVLFFCGHTHSWDDRMAGGCRIVTLPRIDRGYAMLELSGKDWKIQTHQ